MASKNTPTVRSRKAKKVWAQIVAPRLFSNQILGRSHVYETEQLIGKSVKANLMNLTGDIKSQNINIEFRVFGIKNGQGMADIWSYEILPAHVKRIVRRKRDKVEDSFIIETKDNIKLRIKPLMLTLNRSSAAVRTDLRRTAKNSLAKTFKSMVLEDAMRFVLMRKIQNSLKRELSKIAPMRSCDIRVVIRLNKKTSEKAKVVVVAEKKEVPKTEEKAKVAVVAEKKEVPKTETKVVENKKE